VSGSLFRDFRILPLKYVALIVGVQIVLIHQMGNGRHVILGLTSKQLLHQRSILRDGGAQHTSGRAVRLEKELSSPGILLPNLLHDERRVDDDHVEGPHQFLRDIRTLALVLGVGGDIEIIKNKSTVILPGGILLIKLHNKREQHKHAVYIDRSVYPTSVLTSNTKERSCTS
jgi:hypothetical protein